MENQVNNTNVVNEQEIQWQLNRATASNSTFGISSSGTFNIGNTYINKRIINVEFKETTVVVTYRETPSYFISTNVNISNTQPDRVWKEIWGLMDGKMRLLEVINGRHNPAHQVGETFEFDDEK